MRRPLTTLVTVAVISLLLAAATPARPSYAQSGSQGLSNESSSIVIALDTSQSMSGQKLRQAMQMIQRIVDAAKPTDSIGMIGFGRTVSTLAPTTHDHARVLSALQTVVLTKGALLMDGIELATYATAPDALDRIVVVISDGDDAGNSGEVNDLVSVAKQARVSIYAVDLDGQSHTPGALMQLARETGGSSTQASSGKALPRSLEPLGRELQPAARDAEQLSQSKPARSELAWWNVLAGPLVSLPFALLLALIPVWLRRGRNIRSQRNLLVAFEAIPHAGKTMTDARYQQAHRMGLADQAGDRFTLPYFDRLLERANVPLSQKEALAVLSGILLLGLLAGVLWGGMSAVLVPAALVALPLLALRMMSRRHRAAFDRQLPGMLTSLASSLRVGHSFLQGLTAAVTDAPEPLRSEFQLALAESRFGRPLESALQAMATRLRSREFNLVVTVVAIQRQVGGSLAPMIDIVSKTLQERQTFSKRLRALTSQGRASAMVLIGMPIVIGLVLNLMSPDFMAPLLHTSQGHTMLFASAVWMSIGALFIRRIVSYQG